MERQDPWRDFDSKRPDMAGTSENLGGSQHVMSKFHKDPGLPQFVVGN